MSNKLPPLPVGVAPGSGYWNDWYEKLRTLINGFTDGFPFSSITDLPTTLAGYGITDATPSSHVGSGGAQHANAVAAGAAGFMSGADKTKLDGAEVQSNKDSVSGYAGLNGVSRVTKGIDTTDDIIIDSSTTGLVLKDSAGTPHYWRITVTSAGVLTITDIGTTKP